MHLLITGATGFLGRHVVDAALRRGHRVRAMIRPTAELDPMPAADAPASGGRLEVTRHDLRARRGLVEAVRGVDGVLHLAAAKTGSFHAQMAGTVVATENLLDAMRRAGVDRLVLVSSFAVYDYLAIPARGTLAETSPLEAEPARRDAYCQTKLLQERLAREAAEDGVKLTVLRPGVVYAEPEQLWTDRLGIQLGRMWLATGSRARLPLTHVRHCAEAIVLAAEREQAVGQTLNLVDDDPPTQGQYRRALRRLTGARVVPVNWTLMRSAVWLLDAVNRHLLHGAARLPAILRRRALHARCRPLRYSNQRAREVLAWSAPSRWRDAVQRAAAPPGARDRGASENDLSSSDTPCVSRT